MPGGAPKGRAVGKTDVPVVLHLVGADIFGLSRGLGLLELQGGRPWTIELEGRLARGGAVLAV